MDKIDKDKFRKHYTCEYSRVFSKEELMEERKTLTARLKEIDDIMSEMSKLK